MSKHLRTALEQLKQFYITKIMDAGHHGETTQELKELTVSELEAIYRHNYQLDQEKKYPQIKNA